MHLVTEDAETHVLLGNGKSFLVISVATTLLLYSDGSGDGKLPLGKQSETEDPLYYAILLFIYVSKALSITY